MNKKLLSMLSLALLVSILPACGKKDMKRSDKKMHHKNKDGKHKTTKVHKNYRKEVVTTDEEEMK